MAWKILYHTKAKQQYKRFIKGTIWQGQFDIQIAALKMGPDHVPPSYKYLKHNLAGLLSRKISGKDRIVYSFDPTPTEDGFEGKVYIHSCWGHYDDH